METVDHKQKYLSKVIQFNGHKMTLYSLDGQTWSSKKFELADIQERREQQRLALAGKKEDSEFDAEITPKIIKEEEQGYDDLEEDSAFVMEPEIEEIEEPKIKVKKPKLAKVKAVIKKETKNTAKAETKVAKLPKKPKALEAKSKKIVAKANVAKVSKANSAKKVKKAVTKKIASKSASQKKKAA